MRRSTGARPGPARTNGKEEEGGRIEPVGIMRVCICVENCLFGGFMMFNPAPSVLFPHRLDSDPPPPPLANREPKEILRTEGRREMGEAALERSHGDASKARLTFLKMSRVMSTSDQSPKCSVSTVGDLGTSHSDYFGPNSAKVYSVMVKVPRGYGTHTKQFTYISKHK